MCLLKKLKNEATVFLGGQWVSLNVNMFVAAKDMLVLRLIVLHRMCGDLTSATKVREAETSLGRFNKAWIALLGRFNKASTCREAEYGTRTVIISVRPHRPPPQKTSVMNPHLANRHHQRPGPHLPNRHHQRPGPHLWTKGGFIDVLTIPDIPCPSEGQLLS